MPDNASRLIFRPNGRAASITQEGSDLILNVPMPQFSGPPDECLLHGHEASVMRSGAYSLLTSGNSLGGIALTPADIGPEEASHRLYVELCNLLDGRALTRIWNYIPQINAVPNDLENYRAFNAGRLRAFKAHYGSNYRAALPAASALGIHGRHIAIAFIATKGTPTYFENPEQTAACEYPAEFGLQPPAFARGTRFGNTWHLSGTASVKGHRTQGLSIMDQMHLTLENIEIMRRTMQVPDNTDDQWKIFVRHAADIDACRDIFAAKWRDALSQTMFLHADICRSCLLVEIEGAFSVPANGSGAH